MNTTKYVVMKRTKVNQEKQKIQRTENGRKGRENGGKGWENGSNGRTLKIEVQILPEACPKGFYHGFCDSSGLFSSQAKLC